MRFDGDCRENGVHKAVTTLTDSTFSPLVQYRSQYLLDYLSVREICQSALRNGANR